MEELQPIEWRVWAGKVERERKGGPYIGLEERMGFVDIRVRDTPRSGGFGYVFPVIANAHWLALSVDDTVRGLGWMTLISLGQEKGLCRLGTRSSRERKIIACMVFSQYKVLQILHYAVCC